MTVWKFGCNWGGNQNNFYDFIRDESIVIGHQPRVPFRLDDLVLITNGHLVRAIAQVHETPRSLTESDYRFVTNQYGIKWAPTTIFSKAEWYELPPNLQFQYRCQRGAVQVRKQAVLNIANELWNNRK